MHFESKTIEWNVVTFSLLLMMRKGLKSMKVVYKSIGESITVFILKACINYNILHVAVCSLVRFDALYHYLFLYEF